MQGKGFWIILIFVVVSFSCRKGGDSIYVGDLNNDVTLVFTDTISANLSTVLVDSLPSSVAQRLLVGAYNDASLGKISSSTYFQVALKGNDIDGDGVEDILTANGTPVYDSLVLILDHNYSYGDTTALYKFSVHEIKDYLVPKNPPYIYNATSYAYNNTPLASKSLYIANVYDDSVRVKLSDAFGQNFFNLAKNRDFRVSTNDFFQAMFHGLTIIPDVANNAMIGYSLHPIMRLYYHVQETPGTSYHYDFIYKSGNYYYNRITEDRSATSLSTLKLDYDEVNSYKTNNQSYLLTGIVLMPKITFPYLQQIRSMYPNATATKATLTIIPKPGTYNQLFYLPKTLTVYKCDNSNVPQSISGGTSTTIIADPTVDWQNWQNNKYSFEISGFINQELSKSNFSGDGILLASPVVESSGRAEKLVLATEYQQNSLIKVEVYLNMNK